MPSNPSSLAERGGGGCFFLSGEEPATPSVLSAFLPWLLCYVKVIMDESSTRRSRDTI